jgi:cytochrome c oxidase subunit 3
VTSPSSPLPWPQEAGLGSAERDDLVQIGVWMFLATVVMLFAAFTSAYIVHRGASNWAPIELPGLLWLNTAVLAASNLAIERGRRRAVSSQTKEAARAVAAATALGLLFLGGQYAVWQTLDARGVFLPTSAHGAFVYLLTGAHGVHVVAGVALLAFSGVRMGLSGERDDPASLRLLTAAATFWHFLAALWAYVFLLLAAF